ncbi:MAG: 5-oxoprolinase subunit PxpA [Paracoccus sp. (in: a-proteobacteria)]|nr:5-oxoprolinase subunit PxpA [Paracoccus sp. (in: a-proteobacteria)]
MPAIPPDRATMARMTTRQQEGHLRIDLNSDLGEGYGAWRMGDDTAMLDIVSSANIACGFHAGDPLTLLTTVRAAAARGVAVGAHVSYPDLVGFGRRAMEPGTEALIADVIYQIGAISGVCAAAGVRLCHVKPHGALYNTIARDARQAGAVIAAIRAVDARLVLVGLAGSPLLAQARDAGLAVIAEAFADRGYCPDGSLMPRGAAGAVLHDPAIIAARMVRLVTTGEIEASDGSTLHLAADSICVHGDNPAAVAIARHLHGALTAAGIAITAPAGAAL